MRTESKILRGSRVGEINQILRMRCDVWVVSGQDGEAGAPRKSSF